MTSYSMTPNINTTRETLVAEILSYKIIAPLAYKAPRHFNSTAMQQGTQPSSHDQSITTLRRKRYLYLVHIGEESRSYFLQFEIAQTSELENCGAYRYEGGAPRTRPPSAPLTVVSQLYLNLFTHLSFASLHGALSPFITTYNLTELYGQTRLIIALRPLASDCGYTNVIVTS